MIKKISRVEQLPIINALVIINYTGTAAKSRRQASILNLLVKDKTTQQLFFLVFFFSPFEKQDWTDQGQYSEMCGWLSGTNAFKEKPLLY